MNPVIPYPLNPNLSCVERVRTLFREITKRRLISSARIRPGGYMAIHEWVMDMQTNTLPMGLLNEVALRDLWDQINQSTDVREFLFGLAFETRMRCFEEQEDFDAYVSAISSSVTQFNDQLSVIPVELLSEVGDLNKVKELLMGNTWVLPVILLEQMEPHELGVELALSEMETANARSSGE